MHLSFWKMVFPKVVILMWKTNSVWRRRGETQTHQSKIFFIFDSSAETTQDSAAAITGVVVVFLRNKSSRETYSNHNLVFGR
jgi:hypothetical protein